MGIHSSSAECGDSDCSGGSLSFFFVFFFGEVVFFLSDEHVKERKIKNEN
jgi:hypothetical protein